MPKQQICRICLYTNVDLKNIYTKNEGLFLSSIISDFAAVNVSVKIHPTIIEPNILDL